MLIFLIFFYLFPISFLYVPLGLTTRILLSIFGSFRFVSFFNFAKGNIKILMSCIAILIFSCASVFFNHTRDIQFIVYPVSILLIYFAANFIVRSGYLTLISAIKYIVFAGLIQNILSLLMFFNSDIGSFLNGIQLVSDADLLKIEEASDFRILGFGSSFFTSGIINGIILLFISFLYIESRSKSERIWWVLIFFIMAFISVLKARTIFIAIFLCLLYMIILSLKNAVVFLFYFLTILILLYIIILQLSPDFFSQIELLMNFGFEIFIKYFEFGSLESNSTNELKEMYVYPTDLKTYFIGDGLWMDKRDSTYYMGTDVGYLRLIFYFGIPGLISYIGFQFFCFQAAWNKNNSKNYKFLILFLFILFILLNFKGFTDFFFVLILLILINPSIESKQA